MLRDDSGTIGGDKGNNDTIDENDQESGVSDVEEEEEESPNKKKQSKRAAQIREISMRLSKPIEVKKVIVEDSVPQKVDGPKYKHNSFIIQKYIERPFLINERKFDIRIWIFVNSDGNAYFCEMGYLRTSSNKFVLDDEDPDNRFVHLTNIAVQKYS